MKLALCYWSIDEICFFVSRSFDEIRFFFQRSFDEIRFIFQRFFNEIRVFFQRSFKWNSLLYRDCFTKLIFFSYQLTKWNIFTRSFVEICESLSRPIGKNHRPAKFSTSFRDQLAKFTTHFRDFGEICNISPTIVYQNSWPFCAIFWGNSQFLAQFLMKLAILFGDHLKIITICFWERWHTYILPRSLEEILTRLNDHERFTNWLREIP